MVPRQSDQRTERSCAVEAGSRLPTARSASYELEVELPEPLIRRSPGCRTCSRQPGRWTFQTASLGQLRSSAGRGSQAPAALVAPASIRGQGASITERLRGVLGALSLGGRAPDRRLGDRRFHVAREPAVDDRPLRSLLTPTPSGAIHRAADHRFARRRAIEPTLRAAQPDRTACPHHASLSGSPPTLSICACANDARVPHPQPDGCAACATSRPAAGLREDALRPQPPRRISPRLDHEAAMARLPIRSRWRGLLYL